MVRKHMSGCRPVPAPIQPPAPTDGQRAAPAPNPAFSPGPDSAPALIQPAIFPHRFKSRSLILLNSWRVLICSCLAASATFPPTWASTQLR